MADFNGAYYTYLHNLQGDVVGLVDSSNNLVVEYKYDAWGRPTLKRSLTTAYDTLATLNPFRYRGYVYDEETGLYYLRSRYYNPVWARFVIPDIIVAQVGSIDNNAFAYCNGSPIMLYDADGTIAMAIGWGLVELGKFIVSLVVAATAYKVTETIIDHVAQPVHRPEVEAKETARIIPFPQPTPVPPPAPIPVPQVSPNPNRKEDKQTVIYRYGKIIPTNFVSRPVDVDTNTGLSFSTIPRRGAAMTTIEALNATGFVYAEQNGTTHVSVYPIGGTLKEWQIQGAESRWTQAILSVVVKYGG